MDRDPCAICLEQVRTYVRTHMRRTHARARTQTIYITSTIVIYSFRPKNQLLSIYILEILTCLLLCCLLPTTTSVDVDTFGEEAVFETANHLRDEVLQVRVVQNILISITSEKNN